MKISVNKFYFKFCFMCRKVFINLIGLVLFFIYSYIENSNKSGGDIKVVIS